MATGLPLNEKAKRKAGANIWDPSPNTFSEYLENKAYPQVNELLRKFPDMKSLWYDMGHFVTPEQSLKFYQMAYEVQPNLLVNSRVGNGLGDFEIPGDNKIPQDHLSITKPWQTVGTTNNSWGYNSYDNDWKSVKELMFWLVEIVSKGGNYMLNIGPKASGEVPEESVTNLLEVGKFLALNGEAIYNTRKWKVTHEGPTNIEMNGTHDRVKKSGFSFDFTSQDFWFTQKENCIYAIALKYPIEKTTILSLTPKQLGNIKYVSLLGTDTTIHWNQTENGLEVDLGTNKVNPNGYALKIIYE